jgi:hypothetical protein
MIKRMCNWTRSEATSYVKAHQAIVIQHTQSWNHITLLLTLAFVLAHHSSRVQTVLISPCWPSISSCMAPRDPQAGQCKQWLAESTFTTSRVAVNCAHLLAVSHRRPRDCTRHCHAGTRMFKSYLYIAFRSILSRIFTCSWLTDIFSFPARLFAFLFRCYLNGRPVWTFDLHLIHQIMPVVLMVTSTQENRAAEAILTARDHVARSPHRPVS